MYYGYYGIKANTERESAGADGSRHYSSLDVVPQ